MNKDKILVICEMANNHMGEMDHGRLMIDEFASILGPHMDVFDFAWKFQFRNLDTFIHKDYRSREDHKYVKRFQETNLSQDEFRLLRLHAREKGFLTMCTAFDEKSVDNIIDLGFEIIKVASCSFTDWPLLNKIAETDKPIILSTAGVTLKDIDRVVSFMQHRDKEFSLMHCVGEYPTPPANLQLNQIDLLRERYPGIKVGYSTHEEPSETGAIRAAVAKGASIVEKHVAVNAGGHEANAYSVTPAQMSLWISAARETVGVCGQSEGRKMASPKELEDLGQFKRGAFAKRNIKEGETLSREDIYYAWPSEEGQFLANDISKYLQLKSQSNISQDAPLYKSSFTANNIRGDVWDVVQNVKSFLDRSQVVYPPRAELEISHHYGIEEFDSTGITMITVVNRDYCKKLIIILPGQSHPEQYHLKKEETFVVLHGELNLHLSGAGLGDHRNSAVRQEHNLSTGDVITIEPETKHSFTTVAGCILEEISSTHYVDDSYYTDPNISKNKARKTFVSYWT